MKIGGKLFPGGGGNGGDGNGGGSGCKLGDDDDDTDDTGPCNINTKLPKCKKGKPCPPDGGAGGGALVVGGNLVGAASGNNAGGLAGNLGGAGSLNNVIPGGKKSGGGGGEDECCDPPVNKRNSPSKLRKNLIRGIGGPADEKPSKVSDNPQAHHIAEGGRMTISAKQNRAILFEVCINLNDAVNGVWLPRSSHKDKNYLNRVYHNYTYPRNNQIKTYDKYVSGLLSPVRGNRNAIKSALKRIRRKLSSGSAPWLPSNIDPTKLT